MVQVADELMIALFKRLPEPGETWPMHDRMLWLSACEAAINLIYGEVEKIDVRELLAPKWEEGTGTFSTADVIHREPPETRLSDVADEPIGELVHDEPAPAAFDAPPVKKPKAALPPLKNVGGRPSSTRPEGLPTNAAMAIEAIEDLGGKASAPQIRNWTRKKYWPDIRDSWTACLWDLVVAGKLARDGLNFILPKAKPEPKVVIDPKPEPPKAAAPEPAHPPRMPSPGQKLGPPARGANEATFEYEGKQVNLRSNEYMIAKKLCAAMGKGHISVPFLAENVLGMSKRNAIDSKLVLKDLCEGMGARLRTVGLRIDYFEGFGFLMKEV